MIDKEKAIKILTDIRDGWASWVPANGSPAHENVQALDLLLSVFKDIADGELVPCPHCGKPVHLVEGQYELEIVCSDKNCLGGMKIYHGACANVDKDIFKAKLIANWNKRNPESVAITAAIECIHDYGEKLYQNTQEPYDEHGQCCINVVEEILNRLQCFTSTAAVNAWYLKGSADHG